MVVDLFLVYQFIRRLATPFNKWDAYKLGIIDENGKVLIKRKNFTRAEQSKAWGRFDIMIANLKKLLAKVPGGSSKIASYAAALFLIKEYKHFSDESLINEDFSDEQLDEALVLFENQYGYYINISESVNQNLQEKEIDEEVPANNVSSGNIAGMDGNSMSKASQKKWTRRNKSKRLSFKETIK